MRKPRFLSYDTIEQYHRDGYLVLRGVFSAEEVKVWQAECDRLLKLDDYIDPLNVRVAYRKQDGKQILEKFDPVHDLSPVFSALTQDERILSPLRDIYLDEPLLFKDKLIFKLPGVGGYSMHQDASWWQGFPYEGLISVMVAIDGADRENGGLELFPGYHTMGLLSTPGELRNMNEEETAKIDLSKGELIETQPGDLIFFHSLTPHRSGLNTSNRSRRQLYLTYSPSRNGQLYKAHYQHYVRYLTRGNDEETKRKLYFK